MTDSQRMVFQGPLIIMEIFDRQGDTELLRSWIDRRHVLFQACPDPIFRSRFADFEDKILAMESFEAQHGYGSCLNLQDASVKRLLDIDPEHYPLQMVQNAKRAALVRQVG